MELPCDARRAVHKPVCALDQEHEAHSQEQNLKNHVHFSFLFPYFLKKRDFAA